MNDARRLVVLIAACVAGLLSACGPQRVRNPERPDQTIVVLLPDPDTGIVGKVVVSNALGTADLATARASTRVSAGRPPAPVTPLSEAEAQALFADVLSALPPPPRHFTLFFRFESEELTEESRAFVPEILQAAKDRPVPEIVVVGHTDTTGAPASNVELGLKRAQAVRKLLLDVGVDASLIEITSHGEGNLLVPTDNNTYEPRNRRVEITVR